MPESFLLIYNVDIAVPMLFMLFGSESFLIPLKYVQSFLIRQKKRFGVGIFVFTTNFSS